MDDSPSAARGAKRPFRRRPLAGLLLLFVALLTVGGGYAAIAPGSSAVAAEGGADAVSGGRTLFLKNCSTCHGLHAEGTGNYPSLIGVGPASVDFQVGTGRMPAADPGVQIPKKRVQFNQGEIDQLAAYIGSLGAGPPIPGAADVDPSKGDVVTGGELFRTNCSMCHNFAGRGGALTRGKYAPPLTDTAPRYLVEAMNTGPQSMPVFPDSSISPQQKRDIIAYVRSIKNEQSAGLTNLGSIGPVSEGLLAWLGGIGGLIAATVWLAQKSK